MRTRARNVTISGLIEVVVSSAFVFGVVRQYLAVVGPQSAPWRTFQVVNYTSTAVVTAVGLSAGIGLLIEAIRGKSKPADWSLGRWIWSITGIYFLLSMLWFIFLSLSVQWNHPGSLSTFQALYHAEQRFVVSNTAISTLSWLLTALCFTSYITQSLPNGPKDLREWAGRLYASLVVAMCIAIGLLGVFKP